MGTVLLLRLINRAFALYSFIIIAYCLLSWFPGGRTSRLGQIITALAEPYLDKFRRLPLRIGGLDLSPWVALIVLNMAEQGLFIVLGNIL